MSRAKHSDISKSADRMRDEGKVALNGRSYAQPRNCRDAGNNQREEELDSPGADDAVSARIAELTMSFRP
jgi:hypothetical protein